MALKYFIAIDFRAILTTENSLYYHNSMFARVHFLFNIFYKRPWFFLFLLYIHLCILNIIYKITVKTRQKYLFYFHLGFADFFVLFSFHAHLFMLVPLIISTNNSFKVMSWQWIQKTFSSSSSFIFIAIFFLILHCFTLFFGKILWKLYILQYSKRDTCFFIFIKAFNGITYLIVLSHEWKF